MLRSHDSDVVLGLVANAFGVASVGVDRFLSTLFVVVAALDLLVSRRVVAVGVVVLLFGVVVVVGAASGRGGERNSFVLRRVLYEDGLFDLDLVLADPTFVAHPERPPYEEDAGEDDLSRKFVPPGVDVLGVADEEGPLAMVFDVKVVVNTLEEKSGTLIFYTSKHF